MLTYDSSTVYLNCYPTLKGHSHKNYFEIFTLNDRLEIDLKEGTPGVKRDQLIC
jgi:hypothetical protein